MLTFSVFEGVFSKLRVKWRQNHRNEKKRLAQQFANRLIYLVRPARLERAACGFEVRRSIQLSYGRIRLRLQELASIVPDGWCQAV